MGIIKRNIIPGEIIPHNSENSKDFGTNSIIELFKYRLDNEVGAYLTINLDEITKKYYIGLYSKSNTLLSQVEFDGGGSWSRLVSAELEYENSRLVFTLQDGEKVYCDISQLIDTLTNLITSETERAIGAETTLQENIDIVSTNLDNEIDRAQGAESGLSQRISTIESSGFITQDLNTSSIAVQYAKSNSRTILSGDGDWSKEDVLNIEKTQLSCAYGNGYYISVGNEGSIVYSQDGIVWEKFDQQFTDRNLDKICFGNGYFLAICFETKTIYRAFSPTIWNIFTTLNDVIPTNLQYINNKFIITCDEGKILLSDIGKVYIPINMPTSQKISSVAYGNGYYVAVGDGGLVMVSKDGIDWLNRSDNTFTDNYKNIIYTNGMFVTHTNDLIRYSTNYYQFVNANIPEIIGYPINNIVYGESKYYVLCSALFGTKILKSIDGKNYTLDYVTNTLLNSIHYGSDTFLCVGEIGHICILDLGIEWYYEKPILGENEYLWARNVNYLNNGEPVYSLAYYMDYIDNTTNELENYYNIVTTDDLLDDKQDNIDNITNIDIDNLF